LCGVAVRFAPWLRRIHIVTDRQTPSLIKALENTPYRDRIRVVDHSEIFRGFEENLPTFNSSTILSVLWRIDDLAENFLFLNDDFALLQPVKPTDFFIDDKVVLRGKWRPFSDTRWSKKIGRFLKTLQLKPGDQSVARLTRKIASADQNPDIAFVCVQSLDRGCEESQQLITRWLDRRIGRLSDLGKPLSD